MDAFVDLDMDIALLNTGLDGADNFGGLPSSISSFDDFMSSFGSFSSDGFTGFDNFYEEPNTGSALDTGESNSDWLREWVGDIIQQYGDSGSEGGIDEVIAIGVRRNDNGTINIFGFTFGGSHPNAANINFCTGIDVISSLASAGSGLGALSTLGGFLGGEGLGIRFSSSAAGGGAGFAALFGGLFLGSAGNACGSVGL